VSKQQQQPQQHRLLPEKIDRDAHQVLSFQRIRPQISELHHEIIHTKPSSLPIRVSPPAITTNPE